MSVRAIVGSLLSVFAFSRPYQSSLKNLFEIGTGKWLDGVGMRDSSIYTVQFELYYSMCFIGLTLVEQLN